MTRGAFYDMKSSIANYGTKEDLREEASYNYPDKIRIVVPEGLEIGRKERKKQLHEVNIALPSAPYDLRLALSVEEPIQERHKILPAWETR